MKSHLSLCPVHLFTAPSVTTMMLNHLYICHALQMSKREYVKMFCDTFLALKTAKLFSLGLTLKIKHMEKMWTLNMSSHAVCAFAMRPLDDLPLRLRFYIFYNFLWGTQLQ